MWERACSRMQWISQEVFRLTHRIREQARSYFGLVVCQESVFPHGRIHQILWSLTRQRL